MVLSGDPVAYGLVKNLAHPGGNTTGVATLTCELSLKRLAVFKESVPNLRDIAVLFYPYPQARQALNQMKTAGPSMGSRIRGYEATNPAEVDTAFTEILRARPGELSVEPSALTNTYRVQIMGFAAKNRLPVMDARKWFPENGGLISYGIDYADHVRAGIRYADKILKGARPADLPVEQ
jgi:putative ABC transport system substrate-binding protein